MSLQINIRILLYIQLLRQICNLISFLLNSKCNLTFCRRSISSCNTEYCLCCFCIIRKCTDYLCSFQLQTCRKCGAGLRLLLNRAPILHGCIILDLDLTKIVRRISSCILGSFYYHWICILFGACDLLRNIINI